MFIGHYALAFGAKRVAPMMSLGTLFLACQFADLLWPTLLVLGLEVVQIDPGNTVVTPLNFVSYPYSHSFVALVGWSALFALAYRAIRGCIPCDSYDAGWSSHYVRDVMTHRPRHARPPADRPFRDASVLDCGITWTTAFHRVGDVHLRDEIYMSATQRAMDWTIGLYALIVVIVAALAAPMTAAAQATAIAPPATCRGCS